MEQGAKALLRILLGALVIGAIVVGAHPKYRATAAALWRGHPEKSPIWSSNSAYYSEVELRDDH